MNDDTLAETVAEATAECGMQQLANWLPADRHDELREYLFDLAYTAIHAFREGKRGWRVPRPSRN